MNGYFDTDIKAKVTGLWWRLLRTVTRSMTSVVKSVSSWNAAQICSVRTSSTATVPKTAHSLPKPNTVRISIFIMLFNYSEGLKIFIEKPKNK